MLEFVKKVDHVGVCQENVPLLDVCVIDTLISHNRMNTILCIMQVAFIGISNWALDPAKMNRGILVQRDVPDEEELIETARLADDALSVFRKYEFCFFKVKI